MKSQVGFVVVSLLIVGSTARVAADRSILDDSGFNTARLEPLPPPPPASACPSPTEASLRKVYPSAADECMQTNGECIQAATAWCNATDKKSKAARAAYNNLLKAAYGKGGGRALSVGLSASDGPAAPLSLGASWQASILNGLTGFLAERAQAEAMQWLLGKLGTKLCDEKVDNRLKTKRWLPETCTLLRDRDGLGAQVPSRILAAAVQSDVEKLPAQVIEYLLSQVDLDQDSVKDLVGAIASIFEQGQSASVATLVKIMTGETFAASCRKRADQRTKAEQVYCLVATSGYLLDNLNGALDLQTKLELGHIPDLIRKVELKLEQELLTLYGVLDAGKLPKLLAELVDGTMAGRLDATKDQLLHSEPAVVLVEAAYLFAIEVQQFRSAGRSQDVLFKRAPRLARHLVSILHGTSALLQSKELSEAVRAIRRIDEMADTLEIGVRLVRAIRNGESPIELIASLAREPALREQCLLVKDPAGASVTIPFGCALATGAVFVQHLSAMVTSAAKPGGMSEREIYEAVVASGALEKQLRELYGRESSKLPERIGSLLDLPNLLDVQLADVRGLLDALAALHGEVETLVQLAKTDPDVAIKHALTLLRHVLKVVDRGAILGGTKDIPYRAEVLLLLDAASKMTAGQYAEGLRLVLEASARLGHDKELPESVRRFVPLFVDLASAQNAGDVKRALENAAAPVGSWKRKHKEFTWGLNGFVGGIGGIELLPFTEGITASPGVGTAGGVLASVGIDFSGPIYKKCTWSHGVFISLIDLGQLTWSRFSNLQEAKSGEKATANVAPEVNFAQIFSPGLYYHISLGDSPFTIGVGSSLAPALRSYTFQSTMAPSERALSILRIGAFVAVDITILPF